MMNTRVNAPVGVPFFDPNMIRTLQREYERTNPYGFPELQRPRRPRIPAKSSAPVFVYSSRRA